MTFGGIVILITALCGLLTGAMAFVTAWRGMNAAKASLAASKRNGEAIEANTAITHRLEINVDGRLSEQLDLTRKLYHALGHAEGVADEKKNPT